MVEAAPRMGGWVSVETRYFISSHPPKLDICWRGHTGASRSAFTWVLDVAVREDASRARRATLPRNLCLLQRMALNTTPAGHHRPGRLIIRCCTAGLHLAYMEKVLGLALPGDCLGLWGSRWLRPCSIIDGLPRCSARPVRDAPSHRAEVPLEPDPVGCGLPPWAFPIDRRVNCGEPCRLKAA